MGKPLDQMSFFGDLKRGPILENYPYSYGSRVLSESYESSVKDANNIGVIDAMELGWAVSSKLQKGGSGRMHTQELKLYRSCSAGPHDYFLGSKADA